MKTQEENKQYLSKFPFKQKGNQELFSSERNTSLFIIGNGFDLMHGLPSSYYNFRDYISKSNRVRSILDTFIRLEEVWGDYESNLDI